jgi:hypothetical protein
LNQKAINILLIWAKKEILFGWTKCGNGSD